MHCRYFVSFLLLFVFHSSQFICSTTRGIKNTCKRNLQISNIAISEIPIKGFKSLTEKSDLQKFTGQELKAILAVKCIATAGYNASGLTLRRANRMKTKLVAQKAIANLRCSKITGCPRVAQDSTSETSEKRNWKSMETTEEVKDIEVKDR